MGIRGEMSKVAVFLDRDGVINRSIVRQRKPFPPSSLEELEILSGVAEGLDALKVADYKTIVVTNQPDVARGSNSRMLVDSMNDWLKSRLSLDAIYTCFHDDSDECDCRKPKPGLLLAAARDFDINLPASYMIGDRWRDMEAGQRAGCKTFFVDYGYDERQPQFCDYRVTSLLEASQIILQNGS